MTEQRRNLYREVARRMRKDRLRRLLKERMESRRSLLERWLPLAVFTVLVVGFLFGFVLRGGEAVYINEKRIACVADEEDFRLAAELVIRDVREDLGRAFTLPEGLTLRKCYVPRFIFREPAALKEELLKACGEGFAYRYVFYIGEKELGAVTEKEKKAVEKVLQDRQKRLLGDYSWADSAEVVEDVWNSYRLAEEADCVSAEDIARKLAEPEEWFTVRTRYNKTEVGVLPYGMEYSYTRELAEGEAEVIAGGKNGVVSTVRCFTEESGEVVRTDIVSRTIISEPVDAKILRGNRKNTGYYFYAPVDSTDITSEFGYRILRGKRNYHTGVDFKVPEGTSVYAAAAGVVTKVGVFGNGAYGEAVVIDHGDGFVTYYAHNSVLLVGVGDIVKKGTLIALSGNTGNSTGPHCHFEVRLDGVKVDPFRYMARPE